MLWGCGRHQSLLITHLFYFLFTYCVVFYCLLLDSNKMGLFFVCLFEYSRNIVLRKCFLGSVNAIFWCKLVYWAKRWNDQLLASGGQRSKVEITRRQSNTFGDLQWLKHRSRPLGQFPLFLSTLPSPHIAKRPPKIQLGVRVANPKNFWSWQSVSV